MNKKSSLKAASMIMICTVISKVIGFLRDILIAAKFGATYQTDAYNIAITVSDVLVTVFSWAIMTTFIPILSEELKKHGKQSMFNFANKVMNILTLLLIIVSILGLIFTPQIVKLLAGNFTGEAYKLAIELTRISIFSVLFMGLTSGYTSILQTLEDFTSTAIVGVVLNIPIILYMVLGAKAGMMGLMIATVIGHFLRALIQFPWLKNYGYTKKFIVDFKDQRIRKMFYLILPVLIGVGVNQINAIVDRRLASGLPQGSITSLTFASRLTDVLYATFASTIVTVLYPALAREGSTENYENFKEYLIKGVNNISIIMIPFTVLFIVLSNPIVTFLFKHGVFDNKAVEMTVVALIFYSVGIPFYGIRDVFNRGLYALNDTKTSTRNSIMGVLMNILFNILFVKYFGIGGIAFATSLAAMICTILLFNSLRKKIGGMHGVSMANTILKVISSSVVMGACTYFVYKFSYNSLINFTNLKLGLFISLTISSIVGGVVYILLLKLLKVKELETVVDALNKKFKRTQ